MNGKLSFLTYIERTACDRKVLATVIKFSFRTDGTVYIACKIPYLSLVMLNILKYKIQSLLLPNFNPVTGGNPVVSMYIYFQLEWKQCGS